MRQWAWLGATPEKSTKSRMEMIRSKAPLERGYNEDGSIVDAPTDIHLPPTPAGFENLWGFFISAGQASQSGFGLIPLSWQELKAFREENELDICVWERDLLRTMSEAYCAESSRATDPKRPAPYKPEVNEEAEAIAKAHQMRESLLSVFRKK